MSTTSAEPQIGAVRELWHPRRNPTYDVERLMFTLEACEDVPDDERGPTDSVHFGEPIWRGSRWDGACWQPDGYGYMSWLDLCVKTEAYVETRARAVAILVEELEREISQREFVLAKLRADLSRVRCGR